MIRILSTDREAIQEEINQLTNEVNRIANTTEFNTKKLLNGDLQISGRDETGSGVGAGNDANWSKCRTNCWTRN